MGVDTAAIATELCALCGLPIGRRASFKNCLGSYTHCSCAALRDAETVALMHGRRGAVLMDWLDPDIPERRRLENPRRPNSQHSKGTDMEGINQNPEYHPDHRSHEKQERRPDHVHEHPPGHSPEHAPEHSPANQPTHVPGTKRPTEREDVPKHAPDRAPEHRPTEHPEHRPEHQPERKPEHRPEREPGKR